MGMHEPSEIHLHMNSMSTRLCQVTNNYFNVFFSLWLEVRNFDKPTCRSSLTEARLAPSCALKLAPEH